MLAVAKPTPQQDPRPKPSPQMREKLSKHFDRVQLRLGGTTREALVHVPKSLKNSKRKLPVVFALHGGKERSGVDMVPNWVPQLDQNFILVLPSGWYEKGQVAWTSHAQQAHGDPMRDIRFFAALKKHVIDNYPADPGRFYLSGFSNGGHEVQWVLCQRPELFEAYGVLMKSLPFENEKVCPKATKDNVKPLLYVAATKDDNNWERGEHTYSAARTAQIFQRRNGCSKQTFDHRIFDAPNDATLVQAQSFRCARAPFRYYLIDGGGHSWPRKQGGPDRPEHSTDVDMSDELLTFFGINEP